MSRRFVERRQFGPSLEWESLPIVGQAQPERRLPVWPVLAIGLFASIAGGVCVLVALS